MKSERNDQVTSEAQPYEAKINKNNPENNPSLNADLSIFLSSFPTFGEPTPKTVEDLNTLLLHFFADSGSSDTSRALRAQEVCEWIGEQAKSPLLRGLFSTSLTPSLLQYFYLKRKMLSSHQQYLCFRAIANLLPEQEKHRQSLLQGFQSDTAIFEELSRMIILYHDKSETICKGIYVLLLNFCVNFEPGRQFLVKHDCISTLLTYSISSPKENLFIMIKILFELCDQETKVNQDTENEKGEEKRKDGIIELLSVPNAMSLLVILVQKAEEDEDLLLELSELFFIFSTKKDTYMPIYHSQLPHTLLMKLHTLLQFSDKLNSTHDDPKQTEKSEHPYYSISSNFGRLFISLSQMDEIANHWVCNESLVQGLRRFLVNHKSSSTPEHLRISNELCLCALICIANMTRTESNISKLMELHSELYLEVLNNLSEKRCNSFFTKECQVVSSTILKHFALPSKYRSEILQNSFECINFEILREDNPDFILNFLIFLRYLFSEESNVRAISKFESDVLDHVFSCFCQFKEPPPIQCEVGRIFCILIVNSYKIKEIDFLDHLYRSKYVETVWALLQSPYVSTYPEALRALSVLLEFAKTSDKSILCYFFPSCWSTWIHRLWTAPQFDLKLFSEFLILFLDVFPELQTSVQMAFQALPQPIHDIEKEAFFLVNQSFCVLEGTKR